MYRLTSQHIFSLFLTKDKDLPIDRLLEFFRDFFIDFAKKQSMVPVYSRCSYKSVWFTGFGQVSQSNEEAESGQ